MGEIRAAVLGDETTAVRSSEECATQISGGLEIATQEHVSSGVERHRVGNHRTSRRKRSGPEQGATGVVLIDERVGRFACKVDAIASIDRYRDWIIDTTL